jgi:hypothetical protein
MQRLSDQRRSLALAGLALGAVVSAAVLRRRRRGGEIQFESQAPPAVSPDAPAAAAQPEAEAPVSQPDSGPPAAVDVPPPAGEPELVDQAEVIGAAEVDDEPEAAINAPKTAGATTAGGPTGGGPGSEAASSATREPATGELSAEEASILSVLAQSGRSDEDRTAIAVATSLERDTDDVTGVLRKLGAEGVVSGDLYTAAGDKIWAVTERGVRRLGAQS